MDLLDEFMAYSEGMPSPAVFRLWGGISMIGAALERRCFMWSADKHLYPNLFTLLVAPPGVGKFIIQEVRDIFKDCNCFKMAPNSVTKASLIDALAGALTLIPTKDVGLIEYHSLIVAVEEFGVLFPAYDLDFLSVLNYIYNNPRDHSEQRRSVNRGEELVITNPQLNILSAVQPAVMSELFPETAWASGTASRLLMIYDSAPIKIEIFPKAEIRARRAVMRKALVDRVKVLRDLRGEFIWAPDSAQFLQGWYNKDMPPTPKHSKLLYYNNRRILHIQKLALIACISRANGEDRTISMIDLARAQQWLLDAESIMPDIFRSMTQKSDYEVMLELHRFVWREHTRTKNPVPDAIMIDYMSQRVSASGVLRVIELAEKSNMIERLAGTALGSGALYKPVPKGTTGSQE